jgi:hypothetical protein
MSPNVNLQMSFLVEAFVTIWHVALITLSWLLADFRFFNLEGYQ